MLEAEAEDKSSRPRPRPRPKIWPRGQLVLEDLTSLETSIKLIRVCVFFVKKMCELAAIKRQGQRMGEVWVGHSLCVCNANEHGPPQLFLHCCIYMRLCFSPVIILMLSVYFTACS